MFRALLLRVSFMQARYVSDVAKRVPWGRERWGWYGVVALALLLHLAALVLLPLLNPVEPSGDLQLFFDYGRRLAAGEQPYRDFTFEYPPLAAPAFWLPTIFGSGTSLDAYRFGFAVEMIACDLLAVGAALWAWRRHRAALPFGILILWPLWLLIAGQSLALERFDLWPAALVVVALALALHDWSRLAWIVIGLGAASKLYPLLLAPLLLMLSWQTRSRRQIVSELLACVLAILVPTAIVTRGDPLAVHGFIDYHLARGLEIESVPASLLLRGRFFGHELAWTFRYGSIEILAPLTGPAIALTTPLALLVVGACYAVAWRTHPQSSSNRVGSAATFDWLVRYSLATIAAFALFGKVLSPQYLLWFIPLVALLFGRRGLYGGLLMTVALMLTRAVNPFLWSELSDFAPAAIVVLLARNAALLGFFVLLLIPARPVMATATALDSDNAWLPLRHKPAAQ